MKPEDKKLINASEAIKREFEKLHAAELALLRDEILKLKLDKNGGIAMSTENMRIRAQILEKYRQLHNEWIAKNVAPADWIAEPIPEMPNTLAGQAVAFGKWYAEQGIRVMSPLAEVTLAENLQQTVRYVMSVSVENQDKLRQILTRGILTPDTSTTYKTIMGQLEEGFGLRPNVAETVFRGTVMQTFRNMNAAAASEMNTELYQHTGPPPRPMPNGHEFCIDHYGETHTLDEWKDIASGYNYQGGTDPELLLDFCGGYQCRHGLRPVAPDNFELAKDDEDAYKEIQQDYLDNLP
jgi:hypothetical protein